MQNGLDAVWQHAFGVALEYPEPRYSGPVIMDPASFRWVAIPGAPGVERKHLGTFTERGTWAEMLRLGHDAKLAFGAPDARELLFVLSGTGITGDSAISTHAAIQLDPGESAEIVGHEAIELLMFGLPKVA